MPATPSELKTLAATLAVAAALALSATLAVRAKIRDEGARSVAAALDAAFGRDGWSAGSVSFDQSLRVFTAEDVRLRLPDWILPPAGGGDPGSRWLAAAGPVEAARLVVTGPPLPMALASLAAGGFRPGASAAGLFESLALESVRLPLARGGIRYRAEAARLLLRGAALDPSPSRVPEGIPEALGALRLAGADLLEPAVFREGEAAPFARARSLSLRDPRILAAAAEGEGRPGLACHLAAGEAEFAAVALRWPDFTVDMESLKLAGPLYGAGRGLAAARRETAAGVLITAGLPRPPAPAGGGAGGAGAVTRDSPGLSGDAGSAGGAGTREPLSLSADHLAVAGGDLFRILSDLREHLASLPPGEPAAAVPLSLALLPPVDLESAAAGGVELSSEGGRILRLEGIRVLGPLAKGAPAPSQTIDLEGLAVYLSSPLLPSLAPPPALGGTRAAAGAQACGAGAAPVPEASRHPPLLLPRLAIEARYTERLGSVVVPSFTLEADGLFGISGSLVLLGAGRPFLEDLGRATLARPGTVLDAPSAGGISVAAFDLEYSDRGLARALLASAAARGAPGGSLDALASSLGILALARMDPFAVNAPEIVSELRDFALDPAGISFSFAAEEPLSLGTVRRVLLDPLLRDEGERDARAAAALLARLRVSLAVSGRRPVDVQWRDVPPAFMAGMSPTQTRHDGLGDLERR